MPNVNKKYLITAVFMLIVILMCMFQVTQGSKALLLRFGRLVVDSNGTPKEYDPGLHFKLPFINQAVHFDVRLQTMGGNDRADVASILTKEQKYVLVDYFVKWRVADVALYYQRTGGKSRATEVLLRQSIDDALRAVFGERTITEVVSGQRSDIMDLTRSAVDKSADYLGIDVIDVRVKRIDLPKEVSDSVYERMRAERERIATKHRSDGKKEAEKIRAQIDAKVTILIAEASAKAAKIRAVGRAKAAAIYDNAYSKNADFYAFMRSLIAYEKTFSTPQDVLVLQPDSEFFDYFKSDHPKK